MIENQLQLLGLSDKEATLFTTLNRIGASPASTLARVCNFKRTSVYDIVNGLLEKNLIISFRQGQYTYYAIDDLNKILLREKDKVAAAKSVVEELKTDRKNLGAIAINYYVGQEGYRQMYEDILKARPKEMLVWIHFEDFYKVLDPVFEEQWTRTRIKMKIGARLLTQDTPMGRKIMSEDAENYRETRIIKGENLFHATCILYENHIALFDSAGSVTGIRIKHADFYNMQKQIFEMGWNYLAPPQSEPS